MIPSSSRQQALGVLPLLLLLTLSGLLSACSGAFPEKEDGIRDPDDTEDTDESVDPIDCKPPEMECDHRCVDINTDPEHCGGCGHDCEPEERCDLGECVDSCEDECPTAGASECSGEGIRTCGEHDGADPCLEWSAVTDCEEGFACDPETVTCREPCGDFCDPFSVVLIPDTQYYTEKLPDDDENTYYLQAQWIIDHQASDNIQFTIHLGDITDDNTSSQWRIASQAHQMLDEAGVPYSVLPGNHDYRTSGDWGRGDSQFDDYFGPERFEGQPWYGGGYGSSNTSNYTLFEVGPMKFMVMSLEYAPRKDVLCWAEDIIADHPEHRVIIATHCYQTHGGGYSSSCPDPDYNAVGSDGQSVWNELASRHGNVFLVVAGHVGDSEYRASAANGGNDVHELLVDYQFEGGCDEDDPADCSDNCRAGTYTGNGWLRLLRFDPRASEVRAETITVEDGNADLFPGGEPVLYCSPLYDPSDPDADGGNWYAQDPTDTDHSFSFPYDLVTPVTYTYEDLGLLAFNDRTVNSEDSGDQDGPRVALSGEGAFIGVWEDDSSDADGSGNLDVLLRGFAPCACESIADIPVHSDTSGDQREASVAMDASGNFVVVWADDTDDNGYYQIRGRGFNADGSERIAEFTVNSESDGQQRDPDIAMAPDGRFVVAWEDDQDRDDNEQIWVRGFNADGTEHFADQSVHSDDSGLRVQPSVGMDSSGNFVVAWQDDSDENGVYQIHARGFDADGSERIARFTVNSVSSGQQRKPSIGLASAGTFVIAWEDDQESDGDYQIMARSYTAEGDSVDEWVVVSGGQHLVPAVSMAPAGAFAVAWQDDADSNGTYQIRATSYLADGTTWRAESTINREASGQQTSPDVGFGDSGVMVVLWTDDMDDNGIGQILATGLDAP